MCSILNYNTVTAKKIWFGESAYSGQCLNYELDNWKNRDSILGRGQNTSSGTFTSPLGHTQPRTQWGAGSLSEDVQRPERETDHSHPVPWLTMGGDTPSISHMPFMTCAVTTLPYHLVNLRNLWERNPMDGEKIKVGSRFLAYGHSCITLQPLWQNVNQSKASLWMVIIWLLLQTIAWTEWLDDWKGN